MTGKMVVEIKKIEIHRLKGSQLKTVIQNLDEDAEYLVFIQKTDPGTTHRGNSCVDVDFVRPP